MSKYRIVLTPSANLRWLYVVLLAVFLLSVWSWNADVLVHQGIIQSLLSLVLILSFGQKIMAKQEKNVISVAADGGWIWLGQEVADPLQNDQWQILSSSRMTPWWHWVTLHQAISNRTTSHLIFKDSMSDENWRHLSRIIKQHALASANAGDR